MDKRIVFSALAFSLLFFGCLGGSGGVEVQAKVALNNSNVTVDYVGSFENGTLFDTSIAEEAQKAGLAVPPNLQPLVFTVGDGSVIKGFDEAVLGMREGESKSVTIPPEKGYGQPSSENVVTINASELDESGGEPQLGMFVSTAFGARGVITAVANETVTIDFNPPLAGKTLVFKMIVRRIE